MLLMFNNQKGSEPERISNVLQAAAESEKTTRRPQQWVYCAGDPLFTPPPVLH